MPLTLKHLSVWLLVLTCVVTVPVLGEKARKKDFPSVVSTSELWQDPGNVRARFLYYGPGGKAKQPGHRFRFIKEDLEGSNPKFDIEDENDVKWKVKLGNEAQAETAATRIVWAVGYHADEDYLIPVLRVEGLPGRISRGENLIQPDGTVLNARLKRMTGRKKVGEWSWRKNPFQNTREFNGLRVMMALIDNWDLKDENNAVVNRGDREVYEVSDLGASFGTTGVLLDKGKAKSNLHSFEHAKFITHVSERDVSFGTPSAPSLPYVFNPLDYESRLRLRWIGKDIPRADAAWIGHLLGQLSPAQIRDAFRAAAYPDAEVEKFSEELQARIKDLNTL